MLIVVKLCYLILDCFDIGILTLLNEFAKGINSPNCARRSSRSLCLPHVVLSFSTEFGSFHCQINLTLRYSVPQLEYTLWVYSDVKKNQLNPFSNGVKE